MRIIFSISTFVINLLIFVVGIYQIMRWIYLHNSMPMAIAWLFLFVTGVIMTCLERYAIERNG